MAGTQYTDARYGTEQILNAGRLTVPTSGAELARFKFFTAVKVKEARAQITTKGNATNEVFVIGVKVDGTATASIGAIAVGTGAIASIVDASLVDKDLAAADEIYILGTGTSGATCVADITLRYQERFTI